MATPPDRFEVGPSPLASDRDRDLAVETLSAACSDGRLGLEAFSSRLESALSARTVAELAALTADLASDPGAVRDSGGPGPSSWFVAVMASTVRRGRWRLGHSSQAITLMGECVLDLRQAEVIGNQSHILAIAVMGSITIIVPDGIDVDLSGAAVMGSKEFHGGALRPLPGAPAIRVTCAALMGEVQVLVKPSSDSAGGHPLGGMARPRLRGARHRRRHRRDDL
ncbi:MAG: DUF1707 domain-containing protein [Candidatus Dormibacteraeota bacterium]|nr:DUF1707 domain-containing protein [Candidatus Dormibacteraeota bacterium]